MLENRQIKHELKLKDIYRITPHTPHTFIQCSTYVKEGVRVINGYIHQNFFTSIPRVVN